MEGRREAGRRQGGRAWFGGDATLNAWPENAGWDFVALGKGHDQAFWTRFLRALAKVDPDMAVNIEHEDLELGVFEGLEVAAQVLTAAAADVCGPATGSCRPAHTGTR